VSFTRWIAGGLLLAAIAGCGQSALVAPAGPNGGLSASGAKRDANRAVLAVFAGLDDYATKKADNHSRIKYAHSQLAAVGSNARADLFLCADSGIRNDSFRVQVTPGQAWRSGFERLGELETNRTPALRDYMAWVGRKSDAANTHALVFTHGGGPGGLLLDHAGKPAVPASSMSLQNTFKALGKGYTGGRMASLTLDACMMGTIEVGEALKGVTEVLTASEDFSMMGATPYDELARGLSTGEATDGEAFGRHVAKTIITRGRFGESNSRTWSAIKLDVKYDRLVANVDRLAKALLDALETEPHAVLAAARDTHMFSIMATYAPHYGDYHQRDLIEFCQTLKRRVKSKAVQAAATEVEAGTRAVILAFHKHPSETMANGLAIYLPHGLPATVREARLKAYRDTAFARHTRWDEFLTALNRVTP
jgi:hypothetical protein